MVSETTRIQTLLEFQTLWFSFTVHESLLSVDDSGVVGSKEYLDSNAIGGHAVANEYLFSKSCRSKFLQMFKKWSDGGII